MSDARIPRPAINSRSSTEKKSGPTSVKLELQSVSGPHSKPSTRTLFPQLFPASNGTIDEVTPVTPGSAPSSSVMRLSRTLERSES